MAHSQIAPIDWLTHVNESHRASEQIRSEARRLLVGRFVRSVEEKVEQGEWTAEALVRSKSRERTFYQVRTKFCVSVGTTTILEHVCSCKMKSLCVHVLAAVLGVQALHEQWSAFPRTIPNPTLHLRAIGRPVFGMNLLGLVSPTYNWADVMAALKSSPKREKFGGASEPKPSLMKIKKFADGTAPIHGVIVRNARDPANPNGASRRAPRAKKRKQNEDESESEEPPNSEDADELSSHASASNSALPPPRKVKNKDFAKAAELAAENPDAPRASRQRRRPQKYNRNG